MIANCGGRLEVAHLSEVDQQGPDMADSLQTHTVPASYREGRTDWRRSSHGLVATSRTQVVRREVDFTFTTSEAILRSAVDDEKYIVSLVDAFSSTVQDHPPTGSG